MKKQKKVFAGFVIKAGNAIEVYTHVSTKNLCYIITSGDRIFTDI
jgi:hypothetical protein